MIRLTQTRMKIHHASSIQLIKNKLFTDNKKSVVYRALDEDKQHEIATLFCFIL
jgi:hypothetical protein